MKKIYARRVKKTRPRFKKRRGGGLKKKNRPLRSQRYLKARVDQVIPLTGNAGDTDNSIGFAWMQREGVFSNVFGHTGCLRYKALTPDYEQYAITGMRLTWIPGNVRGIFDPAQNTNVGGFVGPMYVYDDINSYNTLSYTIDQIIQKDNMMIRDPTRTWSKYLTFRNLAVKMQQKWINPDEFPTIPTSAIEALKGSTALRFQTQGINPNTKLGYFRVSWYIVYRGQKQIQA